MGGAERERKKKKEEKKDKGKEKHKEKKEKSLLGRRIQREATLSCQDTLPATLHFYTALSSQTKADKNRQIQATYPAT